MRPSASINVMASLMLVVPAHFMFPRPAGMLELLQLTRYSPCKLAGLTG